MNGKFIEIEVIEKLNELFSKKVFTGIFESFQNEQSFYDIDKIIDSQQTRQHCFEFIDDQIEAFILMKLFMN